MEIAIAQARRSTTEANTVRSLVPTQLRKNAEGFIDFLEDYYSYLNTDGLPSQEIGSIISEQDIDRTSLQYIDLIQNEIAKNVPNSAAFNKVELYKNIVKYYLTKGSEDSIINFFKIFYDEAITVNYPKTRLFKTSSGDWNGLSEEGGGKYRNKDTSGFLSNSDVLQDSYFWQDFSYVINTALEVKDWKNQFDKLVHPAGFKYFAVLSLVLVRRNKWIGRFISFNAETRKYEVSLPDNYLRMFKTYRNSDLDWMKSLTPPSLVNEREKYSDNEGYHIPMFQYGILGQLLLRDINGRANTDPEDLDLDRRLLLCIDYLIKDCNLNTITRNDYLSNLKFLDSDCVSEYRDVEIKYTEQFNRCDVQLATYQNLNSINSGIIDNIVTTPNFTPITIRREGKLAKNYYNRLLFSNISSFVDIVELCPPLLTISGETITTQSGEDICARGSSKKSYRFAESTITEFTEGQSETIQIETVNVSDGSLITYQITGISQDDLVTPITGSFTVNSGLGSITIETAQDALTEGTEYFDLTLIGVGLTKRFTILDTSKDASFTLSGPSNWSDFVNPLIITLTTTDYFSADPIPYTITGVTQDDISGASLTGSFVVGSGDDVVDLSLLISEDTISKGAKLLTLSLDNSNEAINIIIEESLARPSTVFPYNFPLNLG